MKVSCPNCQRVLQAPDDWAGRTVKCPSCKKPITLPHSDAHHDLGFDLGSLDAIENAGEAVISDRKGKPMSLKEAMAASVAQQPDAPAESDPRIRSCPKCGQKVRSDDVYSDLICRHCGAGIPGREIVETEQARYTSSMAGRMTTKVSFYTGFTGAALYPIPAFPSILVGAGVALAAITVPLLATLAFTQSASLNPVNEPRGGDGDTAGWVGYFLTVMFALEAVYFGAVGYYILIDTIRSTAAGNEQPPGLTWNVINLGAALGGYAALLAFYAIVVTVVLGGLPTNAETLGKLSDPWRLLIIAALTFGVPMNMIGLASSHALDGLNPVRVFRSLGRLVGHYIFLFLIVLLYLCIYVALMYGIMSWAGPVIMEAAQKGLSAGFFRMIGGIAAWSMLIALGFYFSYSIGRILGLFTRSYREEIDFEL